jgi:hypothetical protein
MFVFAIRVLRERKLPTSGPASALRGADDRSLAHGAFSDLMEAGAHRVQYRVVWPDGSKHWLEGVVKASRDKNGQGAWTVGYTC